MNSRNAANDLETPTPLIKNIVHLSLNNSESVFMRLFAHSEFVYYIVTIL